MNHLWKLNCVVLHIHVPGPSQPPVHLFPSAPCQIPSHWDRSFPVTSTCAYLIPYSGWIYRGWPFKRLFPESWVLAPFQGYRALSYFPFVEANWPQQWRVLSYTTRQRPSLQQFTFYPQSKTKAAHDARKEPVIPEGETPHSCCAMIASYITGK